MTAKKLRIKEGDKLLVLNKPGDLAGYLDELPDKVQLSFSNDKKKAPFDVIHIFVSSKEEVGRLVPDAIKVLKKGGIVWVSYPKKSSGITTNLSRDNGWEVLDKIGWQGVSMVSIDDTWSAFRIRPVGESKNRKEGVREIDMKNRTVTIPDDLKEALLKADLLETFEKMAFTHRKEYVLAVVTAKKPETRHRRIEKTVEALNN